MTWFDHETGSVWSQVTGTAILGPLVGTSLPLLASQLSSWADWSAEFPDTVALATETASNTFSVRNLTVVARVGDDIAGLEFQDLRDEGSVPTDLDGTPVVFVAVPGLDRWAVFSRVVDGQDRELELRGDFLEDVDTGDRWDPSTGASFDGERPLERIPTFSSNFANFVDFFPDAEVLVEPDVVRPIQPIVESYINPPR